MADQPAAPLAALGDVMASFTRRVAAATAAADVFTGAMGRVQSAVASFVRLADPGAFARFNLAADRFLAAVGRAMAPLLNNVTVVFDRLAAAVTSFGPAGQQLVAALAAVTVGATVAAGATVLLKTALDVATGGTTAILSAPGGLAAAAGAFAVVAAPAGQVKGVMDRLGGAFATLADVAGQALGAVADATAPLFAAVTDGLAALARAAQPVVQGIGTLAAAVLGPFAKHVAAVGELVRPVVDRLANAFAVLSAALAPAIESGMGAWSKLVLGPLEVLAAAAKELLPPLTLLGQMFAVGLKTVIENVVVPAVRTLADAMKAAAGQTAGLTGKLIDLTEGFGAAVAKVYNDHSAALNLLTAGLVDIGKLAAPDLDPLRKKLADIAAELDRPPGAPGKDITDVTAPNAAKDVSSGGLNEFFRKAQEASLRQALGPDAAKKAEAQRDRQIELAGQMVGHLAAIAAGAKPPPGKNLQFLAAR